MAGIIGSVTCTPSDPRVGDQVLVEVRDPNGEPYGNGETSHISINGIHGSSQYLSWRTTGTKNILVAAMPDGPGGAIERVTHPVDVTASSTVERARLRVERFLDSPTTLQFTVTTSPHFEARTTETLSPFTGVRKQGLHNPAEALAKSFPGDAPAPPVYEWDFDDGTQLGTTLPTIGHDFRRSLQPGKLRTTFNVTVKVKQGLGHRRDTWLRQTVAVQNLYELGKRRGVLRPPADYDLNALFDGTHFRANATAYNPEAFTLKLSSRIVEVFFRDPEKPTQLLPAQAANVTLQPQTDTDFVVKVANSQVPSDAVGFGVHYSGFSGRTAIKLSLYFDIPSRWRAFRPLLSQDAAFALNSVTQTRKTSSATSVSKYELNYLAQRGEIGKPSLDKLMAKHNEPPPAVEGEVCDPTNLPDGVPEDLVCQATAEQAWVWMPGRFMNARKGDVVLSPGGSNAGLIAGLLNNVSPPQSYSHSGIMTRNHDEVTHSTASIERLLDYPVGSFLGSPAPTDGHRPDVLKYLWPGVITQTVEESVEGSSFTDPESGEGYTISGFNPDKAATESGNPKAVIWPLVVKPDPTVETAVLRQKLHEVAKFAADQSGQSHYRFFCYTDPTIGLGDTAPNDSGWAAGTYPTVCSSFIWRCMHETGMHMEGGIEPEDAAAGAAHGPDPEDGLYLYTAEERLAAGEWLYNALYEMVIEMVEVEYPEDLISFFTDLPDDVTTQILNTFASDWSDTDAKDSDAWKSTADARAISPENILWWDGPENDGLYGSFEPLVYRPPRFEWVTIHKWRKVILTGDLEVRVKFKDNPVSGAFVQLNEATFGTTNGSGIVTFTDVPEGMYEVMASNMPTNGAYQTGKAPVTVVEDTTTTVTVHLEGPDPDFRQVVVDGTMFIVDDEWMAAANPHKSVWCNAVLRVQPFDTHDEHTFSGVCDGDVRAELHVEVDWHHDQSVTLTFTGRIFESADPADGIDAEMTRSFDIAAGATGGWEGMQLFNCDDDNVTIDFTATNELQIT